MGFDIGIDLGNGFFQEKAEQIDQGFETLVDIQFQNHGKTEKA